VLRTSCLASQTSGSTLAALASVISARGILTASDRKTISDGQPGWPRCLSVSFNDAAIADSPIHFLRQPHCQPRHHGQPAKWHSSPKGCQGGTSPSNRRTRAERIAAQRPFGEDSSPKMAVILVIGRMPDRLGLPANEGIHPALQQQPWNQLGYDRNQLLRALMARHDWKFDPGRLSSLCRAIPLPGQRHW